MGTSGTSIMLILLFLIYSAVLTSGEQPAKYFRKDYTYLIAAESFYKVHTLPTPWREAKRMCEMEDAILFHPTNDNEMIKFWNETENFFDLHFGLNDLVTKGGSLTVEGRSTHNHNAYSTWVQGQPDNYNKGEDCVILHRDGTLNDVSCDQEYPFICKKALQDVRWSEECYFSRTDYIYNRELNRCYKFHTRPENWTKALTVCHAEESHLAVINSQAEADYLLQLTEKTTDNIATHGVSPEIHGQVLMGFHRRLDENWQTLQGQNLEDSGYAVWGKGQPSGDGSCGSMVTGTTDFITDPGTLNDLPCSLRGFFICEHEITDVNSTILYQSTSPAYDKENYGPSHESAERGL